jgi:hypothetical protein
MLRPEPKRSSLETLVDDYVQRLRPLRERELRFFRVVRTDEEAVSAAALAQLPNRKRHPHQYRIPTESLAESRRRLLDNLGAIRGCASFDELIDLVNRLIRPIDRVGELAVYDAALRIGARFSLEPDRVYLHRGTREGARKLGLEARRETIEMPELRSPLHKLSAREAEDFLCVYKNRF